MSAANNQQGEKPPQGELSAVRGRYPRTFGSHPRAQQNPEIPLCQTAYPRRQAGRGAVQGKPRQSHRQMPSRQLRHGKLHLLNDDDPHPRQQEQATRCRPRSVPVQARGSGQCQGRRL